MVNIKNSLIKHEQTKPKDMFSNMGLQKRCSHPSLLTNLDESVRLFVCLSHVASNLLNWFLYHPHPRPSPSGRGDSLGGRQSFGPQLGSLPLTDEDSKVRKEIYMVTMEAPTLKRWKLQRSLF